jgi:exodeoxyribonuclease VII small subunit
LFAAGAAGVHLDLAQIEGVHGVENEVDQVIGRHPVTQIGREQQRRDDCPLDASRVLSYVFEVPNAPRNPGGDGHAKAQGLAFEEALKKLEAIVEAMESEELPLETLLAKYEEGTRLVRFCQEKLAEADLKVQQLEKNEAGEIAARPLPLGGV